jgi:hypothetical protein
VAVKILLVLTQNLLVILHGRNSFVSQYWLRLNSILLCWMKHTQFKIIKRSSVVLFVFYEHKGDGPLLAPLYKITRQIYLLTSAFYELSNLTIFLWVNNNLIFLLWNFVFIFNQWIDYDGECLKLLVETVVLRRMKDDKIQETDLPLIPMPKKVHTKFIRQNKNNG